MNQFAIYFLLAFVFISYTPAQAGRTPIAKLKKAMVNTPGGKGGSFTFECGDVILEEITGDRSKQYEIVDKSDKVSDRFRIVGGNTVVTSDRIAIKHDKKTITLFPEEQPFELCPRLLPLRNLPSGLSVTKFTKNDQIMGSVSSIVTKQDEDGEWYCVVLQGNSPVLIFPTSEVTPLGYNGSKMEVSFEVFALPPIRLSVQFETPEIADKFNKLILRPQPSRR